MVHATTSPGSATTTSPTTRSQAAAATRAVAAQAVAASGSGSPTTRSQTARAARAAQGNLEMTVPKKKKPSERSAFKRSVEGIIESVQKRNADSFAKDHGAGMIAYHWKPPLPRARNGMWEFKAEYPPSVHETGLRELASQLLIADVAMDKVSGESLDKLAQKIQKLKESVNALLKDVANTPGVRKMEMTAPIIA